MNGGSDIRVLLQAQLSIYVQKTQVGGTPLGEAEGASVLKLHRYSGKVAYLVCPGLERDPDPSLELRIKVTLPALSIDMFDYSRREDPPRLGVGPGLLCRANE